MARPTTGPRLYRQSPGGAWRVRFTHGGQRYDRSTGECDRAAAEGAAARIYAAVVEGRESELPPVVGERRRTAPAGGDLLAHCADWLDACRTTHSPPTLAVWEVYVVRWCRSWSTLRDLSAPALGSWLRERLGQVSASTVRKEASALRTFSAWLIEQGRISAPLPVPDVPARAVGTRASTRKLRCQTLSPAQVVALLEALPEWVQRPGRPARPARLVATLLWETGLRPVTLHRLVYGVHWRRGWERLALTADLDKTRWARDVPLSPRAVAALEALADVRGEGPLVPRVDLRGALRRAGEAAGLPRELVRRLSVYDLRGSRATAWLDAGASLPQVGYLLGHAAATTTARYVRGTAESAARVVRGETPVSGEPIGESGQSTGGAKGGT